MTGLLRNQSTLEQTYHKQIKHGIVVVPRCVQIQLQMQTQTLKQTLKIHFGQKSNIIIQLLHLGVKVKFGLQDFGKLPTSPQNIPT